MSEETILDEIEDPLFSGHAMRRKSKSLWVGRCCGHGKTGKRCGRRESLTRVGDSLYCYSHKPQE